MEAGDSGEVVGFKVADTSEGGVTASSESLDAGTAWGVTDPKTSNSAGRASTGVGDVGFTEVASDSTGDASEGALSSSELESVVDKVSS